MVKEIELAIRTKVVIRDVPLMYINRTEVKELLLSHGFSILNDFEHQHFGGGQRKSHLLCRIGRNNSSTWLSLHLRHGWNNRKANDICTSARVYGFVLCCSLQPLCHARGCVYRIVLRCLSWWKVVVKLFQWKSARWTVNNARQHFSSTREKYKPTNGTRSRKMLRS